MPDRNDIQAIMVTLDVDGEQSLLVLLSSDGTVNRMGNGSVDDFDRRMFIGRAKPDSFKQLSARLTPGLFAWTGQRVEARDPKGKLCELTTIFTTTDGRELTTRWRYGSESQGPHPEVVKFVAALITATDPWVRPRTA